MKCPQVPTQADNGAYGPLKDSYDPYDTVTLTCNDGSALASRHTSATFMCLPIGQWGPAISDSSCEGIHVIKFEIEFLSGAIKVVLGVG